MAVRVAPRDYLFYPKAVVSPLLRLVVRTDSKTLVGMTHLGFKIPEFPVKLDQFGKPKAISYTVGISVSLTHITLLFS